ncbi:thaumatin-like protein 1b [Contarinia nasturtii]|uniref:thaumatin-like protein 1b n=1 Tax=Contarinia nasturtii TaxID=265458 RepID=UPI0012D4B499|nr:thaumatin-like protein 1b [Contarinia nasturtii]
MLFYLVLIVLCSSVHIVELRRFIEVGNRNIFPIWIETLANANGPKLSNEIVRINPGGRIKYEISVNGWAGRLWPKFNCNNSGANCEFGQSIPPCPAQGCHPPADTKVEFFFPSENSADRSFYDISLVDGYSLASEIIPVQNGIQFQSGTCVRTDCRLSVNQCPHNERSGLGDLTVKGRSNNPVACLSPCKKWNYPAPFGKGRNEQEGDGRLLCCPSPVSVQECRRGIVVQTDYVNLVHRNCPTAYSYSYDDEGGSHDCSSDTSFVVNFYS